MNTKSLKLLMQSTIDKVDSGRGFADAFKVARFLVINDDQTANRPGVLSQMIGDKIAYALPSNLVALEAISSLKTASLVEKISDEELRAILIAKQKNPAVTAPADASEDVKAVYALDFEVLKAFYLGELQGSAFYAKVLEILPNSL